MFSQSGMQAADCAPPALCHASDAEQETPCRSGGSAGGAPTAEGHSWWCTSTTARRKAVAEVVAWRRGSMAHTYSSISLHCPMFHAPPAAIGAISRRTCRPRRHSVSTRPSKQTPWRNDVYSEPAGVQLPLHCRQEAGCAYAQPLQYMVTVHVACVVPSICRPDSRRSGLAAPAPMRAHREGEKDAGAPGGRRGTTPHGSGR